MGTDGSPDWGGRLKGGVTSVFTALLEDYPRLVATCFVIPSSGLGRGRDYAVSSERNREWHCLYSTLAHSGRVELAVHGLTHVRRTSLPFGWHTEFAFLSAPEVSARVSEALTIFADAKWRPYGFRQPGWDLSSDLALLTILREQGFRYIAGSSLDAGLNAGRALVSDAYVTRVNGILNIPQNIELDWDMARIRDAAESLIDKGGLVSIKAHFARAHQTNALSGDNVQKLRALLDHLDSHHRSRVAYATMQQIATAAEGRLFDPLRVVGA